MAEKGDAGDADDAADEEGDGVRLVEHVQRDLVHLAVIHRSACVCHKFTINDCLRLGGRFPDWKVGREFSQFSILMKHCVYIFVTL